MAGKTKQNRRTHEDILKLVPQFAKHLKGGGAMKALKEEFSFSSDVPIRKALAEKGYDSKGQKLEVPTINGSGKALAKRIDTERKKGTAWYVLGLATGKTEGEVKALLEEHGFDTEGRVYSKSENGASSKKSSAAKKTPKGGATQAGAGKTKTRRRKSKAAAADPSP